MSVRQPRQPKGTPVGGQFAPAARPPASISLTDDADCTEPNRPSTDQAAQALAYANQAARYWDRRLDIHDVDEIASRALLAYLTQGAPNGVRDLRGYIHSLAKGVAMAHLSRDNRAIRRARAVFADAVEDWAQAHHHWPSPAERAEIAAQVRLRFPSARRPPADYISREVTSLKLCQDDGTDAEPAGTVMWAARLDQPGAGPDEPGGGEPQAEDALERAEAAARTAGPAERRAAKVRLQEGAWSVLAPQGPGTRALTPKEAAKARRLVKDAGGVAKAVSAWEAGRAGEDVAEALFAPFDAPGAKARATVAAVLARHRAYATDIWGAALRCAVPGGDLG